MEKTSAGISKKFLQKQGRILFMSGLNQSGREKITEDLYTPVAIAAARRGISGSKKIGEIQS